MKNAVSYRGVHLELCVLVLLDQLLLEHQLIAKRLQSLQLFLFVKGYAGQLADLLASVLQAPLQFENLRGKMYELCKQFRSKSIETHLLTAVLGFTLFGRNLRRIFFDTARRTKQQTIIVNV